MRCTWLGAVVSFVVLGVSPSLHAQSSPVGTYRCVSISAGKQTRPCSAPPLILHGDGTYQIWAERGTYEVVGRLLVLSESKKRGPGRLQAGHRVVFEYYANKRRHSVVFCRQGPFSAGLTLS